MLKEIVSTKAWVSCINVIPLISKPISLVQISLALVYNQVAEAHNARLNIVPQTAMKILEL